MPSAAVTVTVTVTVMVTVTAGAVNVSCFCYRYRRYRIYSNQYHIGQRGIPCELGVARVLCELLPLLPIKG